MEKDFDYYAFISYKREDEKWAKWLQNKLENYKLPAVIRKEKSDLPKEIRPIFRDKTGMEAGTIIDTIQEKLKRSQYLIVICSPQAAQSNWVGTEINAFIEMGRSDRIIPFIVDGVPNSNDSRECFHPHIKEKIPEPLGINIKEIGKQQAFVKTAAKLLNIRFEVLWDRFQIAQRKRRIIAAVAGSLCIICLLGLLSLAALGILFIDEAYPIKKYYADYTDRWGIPEGIIELNETQVKAQNAHYRFEISKGKLRKVVYANSAGTPIEHTIIEYADRPSIQELKYLGDRLHSTIIRNEREGIIVVYLWSGEDYDSIDLKDYRMNGAIAADIKRFRFTRNNDGYIIRKEFKRRNSDDEGGASNIDGVWGFEYDLDNLGRPKKIRYLGPDGENIPDKSGVMGKKYEYDIYGNIRKVTYFGPVGENIIRITYFDINGNVIW